MSLHEQYEALLRRGMPQHPRLAYYGLGEWYLQTCSVMGDGDVDYSSERIDDADARDLVTMHAMRWWLSLGGKFGDRPRRQVHLIEIDPSSVGCRINAPNHGSCGPEWEASEAIETILAATAHLEPKTT